MDFLQFLNGMNNSPKREDFSLKSLKLELKENLFFKDTKDIESYIFSYMTNKDLFKIRLLSKFHYSLVENLYLDVLKKEKILKIPNKSIFSTIYLYHKELFKVDQQFKLEFNCSCHQPKRVRVLRKFRHLVDTTNFEPIYGFSKHPDSQEGLVVCFKTDLAQNCSYYVDLEKKLQKVKMSKEFIKNSMMRYYNFLKLKELYPNTLFIPTLDIEMVWISHLLKPEIYEEDCMKLFGRVIEHELYLNDSNKSIRHEALIETLNLYKSHYKVDLIDPKNIPKKLKFYFKMGMRRTEDMREETSYQELFNPFIDKECKDWKNPFSFNEEDVETDRKSSFYNFPHNSNNYPAFIKSYERFLYLLAKYPEDSHLFYPSLSIDFVWHSHMMNPILYKQDCVEIVGRYVGHNSNPNYQEQKTEKYWKIEYGENQLSLDHEMKFNHGTKRGFRHDEEPSGSDYEIEYQ